MFLTVVLGTSGEVSIDIALNDNAFTRKWVRELHWCLNNCGIDQQEAFAGFQTRQESADKLISACVVINKYLKNFIEIRCDLLNQPQEYFNYLHQKFEKLSGEFGKPTRLLAVSNLELKSAIRNLNFYIHQTERKNKSNDLYLSFDKNRYRRHPLTEEDYQYFEFNLLPGSLVVHYAELGKDYYDLYKDGLDCNYPGVKNLHYYSGEASLLFTEQNLLNDTNLLEWFKANDIDPYNKKLGHGKILLGQVLDLEESFSKIAQFRHIKEIKIKE